jgi:hypothetical protein
LCISHALQYAKVVGVLQEATGETYFVIWGVRMKRLNLIKALCAVTLTLLSTASRAEYVIYEFTAKVTAVSLSAAVTAFPADSAAWLVHQGDLITGHVYYDAAISSPSFQIADGDTLYSQYFSEHGIGFQLSTMNGFSFTAGGGLPPGLLVTTTAGRAADSIMFTGIRDVGGVREDTAIYLDGYPPAGAQPGTLPSSLASADANQIGYYGNYGGNSVGFRADIAAFTRVLAVPEPETYAMLVAGLAVAGAGQRRKKSHQK